MKVRVFLRGTPAVSDAKARANLLPPGSGVVVVSAFMFDDAMCRTRGVIIGPPGGATRDAGGGPPADAVSTRVYCRLVEIARDCTLSRVYS